MKDFETSVKELLKIDEVALTLIKQDYKIVSVNQERGFCSSTIEAEFILPDGIRVKIEREGVC